MFFGRSLFLLEYLAVFYYPLRGLERRKSIPPAIRKITVRIYNMKIVKSKLSLISLTSGYRKSSVKTLYSHGSMNIADTKQQTATTKSGFHISYSTPNYPLTKSFNVKTESTSMTFRKSHVVFGAVCAFFVFLILNVTRYEQYFMEVTEGYGWFVVPGTLAFFLGIITVCYIAYLIIDKIHSNRQEKMKLSHKIFLGFLFVWGIGVSLTIHNDLESGIEPFIIIRGLLISAILPVGFGVYLFFRDRKEKKKKSGIL